MLVLKKNATYYLLLIGVTLAFLLAINSNARAQLSISPTIFELKSYPGGLQTFSLSIVNTGKNTVNCSISASGFEVVGGGMPVAVDDAPRNCAPWITFHPAEFALKPEGGKRIIGRIRPPRGVSGGYYALISCLAVPESSEDGAGGEAGTGASIRFRHRVQAVVLLAIPSAGLRAIVEPGEPIIQINERTRNYTLGVPVRNRGNIHDRIKGMVLVRSDAGQLIESFNLESGLGFILPEHERLFTSQGKIHLPDGIYSAHIRLDRASGGPMRTVYSFIIKNGQPLMTEASDSLRRELKNLSLGFIISPNNINALLKSGERRSLPIEVRNLTRDQISVQLEISEWSKNNKGWDLVASIGNTHGRSARDWLTLTKDIIKLKPLVKQRIPLLINVPKDAEGEYYAAVTFSRSDMNLDESPRGQANRSVLIRVQSRGTAKPMARVSSLRAEHQPNGAILITSKVVNTGNVGFIPDMRCNVIDEYNNLLGKKGLTDGLCFIQAGGASVFETIWTEVLDPGEYTVELILRHDPDQPPIMERTKFMVGLDHKKKAP